MSDKFFNENTRRYEVGYGKPPKHTRFKKGQSGNPKGRPRFVFEEDEAPLRRYLLEPITVTIKGKKVKMPAIDVIVKSMVQKAAQGCHQTQKLLIRESGGLKALRAEWKRQMTLADQELIEGARKELDRWIVKDETHTESKKQH